MREILFKAKHTHIITKNEHLDGRWIEGFLSDEDYINSKELNGEFLIDPETICQFTGRYDVNKKRIWENDIVKNIIDGDIYKCAWNSYNCEYELRNEKESFGLGYINPHSYEVVGNAIDNPELLKGE